MIPPGSLGGPDVPVAGVFVYGLCLYAVTVRCRPRIVVAAAAVTVAGAAFIDPGVMPQAVFLAAVPILLGVVVRVRRSGERQLEEQERRHSGERALLEERQRIARELHDVVAHHMSVIAIQAEAAPYKTADPPPELVESFGEHPGERAGRAGRAAPRAGRAAYRRSGTPRRSRGWPIWTPCSTRPAAAGVSVTVTRSGNPVTLPEGVDLSAYRIVQEALSNAMRHAPGSHVRVRVAYRPDALALEIGNDAPGEAAPVLAASGGPGGRGPGGRGLRRAGTAWSACGSAPRCWAGAWTAGPTGDGGFRVTAVLPVSPPEEAA